MSRLHSRDPSYKSRLKRRSNQLLRYTFEDRLQFT